MAQAKQASHRKKRAAKRKTIALPVLGAAGASLAMAGGASATMPVAAPAPHNTGPQMALGEEEISDVSLATFYVFDKDNQSTLSHDFILARGGGCRGGGGARGCGGRGCGCARGCARGCRCGRACGCGGVFIGGCLGCGGGCGACWRWSPILGRWVFAC